MTPSNLHLSRTAAYVFGCEHARVTGTAERVRVALVHRGKVDEVSIPMNFTHPRARVALHAFLLVLAGEYRELAELAQELRDG